jgi:hypothetical protein
MKIKIKENWKNGGKKIEFGGIFYLVYMLKTFLIVG